MDWTIASWCAFVVLIVIVTQCDDNSVRECRAACSKEHALEACIELCR